MAPPSLLFILEIQITLELSTIPKLLRHARFSLDFEYLHFVRRVPGHRRDFQGRDLSHRHDELPGEDRSRADEPGRPIRPGYEVKSPNEALRHAYFIHKGKERLVEREIDRL